MKEGKKTSAFFYGFSEHDDDWKQLISRGGKKTNPSPNFSGKTLKLQH